MKLTLERVLLKHHAAATMTTWDDRALLTVVLFERALTLRVGIPERLRSAALDAKESTLAFDWSRDNGDGPTARWRLWQDAGRYGRPTWRDRHVALYDLLWGEIEPRVRTIRTHLGHAYLPEGRKPVEITLNYHELVRPRGGPVVRWFRANVTALEPTYCPYKRQADDCCGNEISFSLAYEEEFLRKPMLAVHLGIERFTRDIYNRRIRANNSPVPPTGWQPTTTHDERD